MPGAIDLLAPKKVALVASNPATSPTTGWPVGFWWAELTHPYWEFLERGFEVTGQQQFSGREAAQLVIDAGGR